MERLANLHDQCGRFEIVDHDILLNHKGDYAADSSEF